MNSMNSKSIYDMINVNGTHLNSLLKKVPDKNILYEFNKYYYEFVLNINKLLLNQEQRIEHLTIVNNYCKKYNFELFRKSLIDNKVVEDFFSNKNKNIFYGLREYILKLEKENDLLEKKSLKRKTVLSYESSLLENKKLKKTIQEMRIEKEEMKKKIYILEKEQCNREYIENSNIRKLLSPLE